MNSVNKKNEHLDLQYLRWLFLPESSFAASPKTALSLGSFFLPSVPICVHPGVGVVDALAKLLLSPEMTTDVGNLVIWLGGFVSLNGGSIWSESKPNALSGSLLCYIFRQVDQKIKTP